MRPLLPKATSKHLIRSNARYGSATKCSKLSLPSSNSQLSDSNWKPEKVGRHTWAANQGSSDARKSVICNAERPTNRARAAVLEGLQAPVRDRCLESLLKLHAAASRRPWREQEYENNKAKCNRSALQKAVLGTTVTDSGRLGLNILEEATSVASALDAVSPSPGAFVASHIAGLMDSLVQRDVKLTKDMVNIFSSRSDTRDTAASQKADDSCQEHAAYRLVLASRHRQRTYGRIGRSDRPTRSAPSVERQLRSDVVELVRSVAAVVRKPQKTSSEELAPTSKAPVSISENLPIVAREDALRISEPLPCLEDGSGRCIASVDMDQSSDAQFVPRVDPVGAEARSPPVTAAASNATIPWLHDIWNLLGAEFVSFRETLVPRSFSSGNILRGYLGCRRSAALFDMSYCRVIKITEPSRFQLLDRMIASNPRPSALRPGMLRFGLILDTRGSIMDECIVAAHHDRVELLVSGFEFESLFEFVRRMAETHGNSHNPGIHGRHRPSRLGGELSSPKTKQGDSYEPGVSPQCAITESTAQPSKPPIYVEASIAGRAVLVLQGPKSTEALGNVMKLVPDIKRETTGATGLQQNSDVGGVTGGIDDWVLEIEGSLGEVAITEEKVNFSAFFSCWPTMTFRNARFSNQASRSDIPVGSPVTIFRSACFTGEDGFVILTDDKAQASLLVLLLLKSNRFLRAAGLESLDMLRLEAGLCRMGCDITRTESLVQASYLWCIDRQTLDQHILFGCNRVLRHLRHLRISRRVGLQCFQAVHSGALIVSVPDRIHLGFVRSTAWSPALQCRIAMGYVSNEFALRNLNVLIRVNDGQPGWTAHMNRKRAARIQAFHYVKAKIVQLPFICLGSSEAKTFRMATLRFGRVSNRSERRCRLLTATEARSSLRTRSISVQTSPTALESPRRVSAASIRKQLARQRFVERMGGTCSILAHHDE